jgi:hypothetical protein
MCGDADMAGKPRSLLKNRLEAVEKVPGARQAKLVPAKAGIQSHNEAYFRYVE